MVTLPPFVGSQLLPLPFGTLRKEEAKTLTEGENQLTARGEDAAGNVTNAPFTVTYTPPVEDPDPSDSPIVVEVENGSALSYPFEVYEDPEASGGSFLSVPNGRGSNWDPTKGGSVTITVTVPQSSTYHFW